MAERWKNLIFWCTLLWIEKIILKDLIKSLSPFEVQRLEAPRCTESKNILVPVAMANPALNFNYVVTETIYVRTVSGQI